MPGAVGRRREFGVHCQWVGKIWEAPGGRLAQKQAFCRVGELDRLGVQPWGELRNKERLAPGDTSRDPGTAVPIPSHWWPGACSSTQRWCYALGVLESQPGPGRPQGTQHTPPWLCDRAWMPLEVSPRAPLTCQVPPSLSLVPILGASWGHLLSLCIFLEALN
jgi:hypothetical protein